MSWFLVHTKYTSEVFNAMIKNPQDRAKIMSKVVEDSGGKIHMFFYTPGSEYDAIAIVEAPSFTRLSGFLMVAASTGNYIGFSKVVPLLTPEEGVEAMTIAGEIQGFFDIALHPHNED
jgi:uncharacterized protein with GYD domain